MLSAPRDALARRPRHDERREHGAGRRLDGARVGVPATIVVPDNASAGKLAAVERLGGRVVRVPWDAVVGRRSESRRDLGGRRRVLRPPGTGPARDGRQRHDRPRARRAARRHRRGARSRGVAAGSRPGSRARCTPLTPDTKVYICEPETGAPVTAALAERRARCPSSSRRRSWTAPGSGGLLPKMWEHAKPLVDGSFADLARGHREDGAAAARACTHRGRGRRGAARSPRRWPAEPEAAASSASSPAGTSTARGSPRSSTAASRTRS